MTLIFWQNILSPHQLPYIAQLKSISDEIEVILVIPEVLSENRRSMGWEADIQEKKLFKIIIAPNEQEIESIFTDNPDGHHLFSGFRLSPVIYKGFKASLKYDVTRYLIVEGPFFYSYPYWAHLIKTYILDEEIF
ncbi:hypothetical protein [Pontibacter sp. BAB1700]|uniref:hypothetical protein n=1 Tax=Pontibacter sp. BAB1700 TaxID=1144253 RepID=UPI00026BE46F|nr:hypothetical protein [Pontibacter sp. BAB1700]EJF08303.1 hypothetical protein O71_21662 [Pontibacter sp. BAB1700]